MKLVSGGSRIFLGGTSFQSVCANLFFFAEKCMKMKEFGPPGGARPWRAPWIRQCWYIISLENPFRSIFVISKYIGGNGT